MTIRAGIIGLGVGEQHIAGYRRHPDAEVVAVCDIDEEKRAMARERYPEVQVFDDTADLIENAGVDVVSVASYDDAHHAQILLALEHRKHVFAEKPLVLHEDHAREIAGMLRERPELKLSQNVPLRMSPRFAELRKAIAAGRLGRLFHMEGDYDYGRRHKLTGGWRGRLPWYSVVLGGAIHVVDLLLWLSRERAVEVMAMSNGIATEGTAFQHDDLVVALIRLESGATAKVSANLGCVSPHFHGVRIYGTDGTFVNGLPDAVIYRPGESGAEAITERVTTPYPGVAKGALIQSFVDSILGAGPPAVTQHEIFEVLAVCFAIERSVRESRPVAVQPLV